MAEIEEIKKQRRLQRQVEYDANKYNEIISNIKKGSTRPTKTYKQLQEDFEKSFFNSVGNQSFRESKPVLKDPSTGKAIRDKNGSFKHEPVSMYDYYFRY